VHTSVCLGHYNRLLLLNDLNRRCSFLVVLESSLRSGCPHSWTLMSTVFWVTGQSPSHRAGHAFSRCTLTRAPILSWGPHPHDLIQFSSPPRGPTSCFHGFKGRDFHMWILREHRHSLFNTEHEGSENVISGDVFAMWHPTAADSNSSYEPVVFHPQASIPFLRTPDYSW
jgi:hypothetical protein